MDKEQATAIEAEWLAALADADTGPGAFRLYLFDGERSETGNQAFHFTPGQALRYDARFPDEGGAQIEDANKYRDRHRIALWVEAPIIVLSGRLRHEIEHARQMDAHGKNLYDVNDVIHAVLGEKVKDLPGGGILYNLNPLEIDANAASARFVWGRFDEETVREAMTDPDTQSLFRSLTGPAPLETLPLRVLHFLKLFEAEAEAVAGRVAKKPFRDVLAEKWPELALAWDDLTAAERTAGARYSA